MQVDTDDLCSNVDIARMAKVTPAAVSNWQARHPDFPRPVASFSNGKFKLYLWSQVREWLTSPHTVTYERPAKVISRTLPPRYQEGTP